MTIKRLVFRKESSFLLVFLQLRAVEVRDRLNSKEFLVWLSFALLMLVKLAIGPH